MLQPRTKAPALSLPLVGGGTFTLGAEKPGTFDVVIFYRGKHCPICNKYLNAVQAELETAAGQGVNVVAVSMDTAERAEASMADWGIDKLPVAYGMSEATAREWGLYISSQRPGSQEPAVFSEPGLVVMDPEGTIFFVQIQSAPFTRPDFAALLGGLKFVTENNYPARGDLTAQAA
ncbi:MAG: peroxiredoxin-like family protein [Pseudomonadota bacterium]